MIAKELRDRIVADVSGDLSPTESEQLLYELLQMPEARQLHQSLQRDRESIQKLQRLSADNDLSTKVLLALARQSPIIRLQKPKSYRSVNKLQAIGVALGLALAFLGAWMISDRTRPAVAERESGNEPNHVQVPPTPVQKKILEPINKSPEELAADTPSPPNDSPTTPPLEKPKVKAPSEILTAPALPRFDPVEVVKPRISLPMVASDFSETSQGVFKKELQRESDHRLEIFTHDTARLADDLTKMMRNKSHNIAADPMASEALRRRVKMGYALYVEGSSVDELVSQVRALARDSKFETLVLTPIAEGDRQELRKWLGRDPFEASEKADGKKPGVEGPPLAGYLSTYPPPKLGGPSKELTSFWDRRPDRSPGKLRLYLILRPL